MSDKIPKPADGGLAQRNSSAREAWSLFGIMSEFIKQGIDVMNHRMPQGFRFPVADVVQGNMQMLVSAVQAISQGEPFDDVFAAGYNPATGNWTDHPTLTAQTTTKDSNIAYPVRGIRLKQNSGSGTTTLTIIQAGGGGNA